MKKINTMMRIVLGALWLMPQGISAQDCAFTPALFPGQESTRTEYEVSATVHVGEYGTASTGKTGTQLQSLTSSNTDVVYTYAQGSYNASIFFVSAGSADVTYTESVPRTCSTNHTIHYTVDKGTPTTWVPAAVYPVIWSEGGGITEGGGSTGSGSATGGGADGSSSGSAAPAPKIYIKEVSINARGGASISQVEVAAGEIEYSSSNESVATISATGAIMVLGTGETTINAVWAGNDNWNGATASYTLNVKKNVILYFASSSVTDTIGNVHAQPALTMSPANLPIHWMSTDTKTATVDENTGEVTMLNNGMTSIRAIYDGDDEYLARTASYTLTVVKRDAHLSFVAESATAEPGIDTAPLALNNPYNVPIDYWQSSDPYTATIEQDGSAIHPLKVGTVTIRAFINSSEIYAPTYAEYTLYINKIGVTVLGVEVTSLNMTDVLGDGKVSFDRSNRFLYLDGWHVDVSAMSDDIKNGVIKDEMGQLTVMLKANSSIVGANRCIYSPGGMVYIRSLSKKDTLILRADASESAVAVVAGGLKMHEALFYTYGTMRAVQCQNLSVTKYGHVFAEALNKTIGMAIGCQSFEKGQGGIGGIEILTPRVYWDSKSKAFFDGGDANKKAAKLIEIGKVPMPLSNDSVTSIAFSDEVKPEDHDNVVFSEGKADKYNEATKKLELASTFTQQAIEEAKDTLIPGSSAWVEELPGTVIFDVPDGSGTIRLGCETEEGYALEMKVGEQTSVTPVPQPTNGEVEVNYDVDGQTRIILYMREEGTVAAPRRIKQAQQDLTVGSYIQTITITPSGVSTGIEKVQKEATPGATKILRDGQLLILRENKTYTVTGQAVK